ncbi:MAG: stage II sporulation protein P [Lachnospiraceae bacterium]|nr:stage II sporulation protein P [Lachnospiraceae bacterium]
MLDDQSKQDNGGSILMGWMQDMVTAPYLPAIRMMNRGSTEKITSDMYDGWILAEYPVLLYGMETGDSGETAAESDYARLLMLEGSDEDRKSISEEELEYDENAMHLEQSLEDALLAENGMFLENQAAQQNSQMQSSDNASAQFIPARDKSYSYNWDDLQEYEMLIKAFYAVDSTTKAGEGLLQIDRLLSGDMRLESGTDDPQILIYHTHSQEAFADSVPGDDSTSIVGVGEYLASVLQEKYGYRVLHHTKSYDKESRDYAYSNSLPDIEQLLAEYPSIEVVIDLHRDEMPADRRLVVDLQGRPTAQFMFFNGLSRTAKGDIEYLDNPNLADNLAFSFQMQAACNEYYPGLARRIYLKAYRYNMHLCPKTLLIELGAQNNTVEEARNACDPLAHVLDLVLSGEEPER